VIQAAFSFFVAAISVLDRQIRSKEQLNRSLDILSGSMGVRFRKMAIFAITCMAMTFFLGLMGWGGGAWLKDSLPIKVPEDEEEAEVSNDRPAVVSFNELQELEPRPIDEDNDLPLEHFEGAHHEVAPAGESLGGLETGLPEYESPTQASPQSPMELTQLSPRPIPDDDPFEEQRLRDEELRLRKREHKLLAQEAQRLADSEKRVRALQALRMEELKSRYGR